ncbi:ribonuclease H1 [Bombyx mori]|uniref:Ribonuclease H1 n=1 Tax=Bombyx mori TaxID=7091 RepID=A0A8R2AKR4_BOMMO|nr:ribonuclease H1 [Bombyx mori]
MSKWLSIFRTVFLKKETRLCVNRAFTYPKMPFYAVAKGRTSGIFMTWADCEAQVKGFSGAKYKKFDTINQAQDYVVTQGGNKGPPSKPGTSFKVGNKKTASNNLKRPYSTTTNDKNENENKLKSQTKAEDDCDEDFEISDDLNTILTKQMDDIEARLKGFQKGVDKIIKKNSAKPERKTIMIDPPEPKKQRQDNNDFETDPDGFVQVYTDGACSANGRSSAKAGLGVYWGDGHSLNVSEPVSGRATNNCGEIQAATKAIRQALQNGITKLSINTDSKFLINSVTKWMPGWKRKGWKLQSGEPVKNEKDFKDLDSVQHKLDIKWNYVEAHRGIHGNEMADQLAKAGAASYKS